MNRFQGLEAPVAIHSLTASDGDSAPRGLFFVLDPNRLNACYHLAADSVSHERLMGDKGDRGRVR